MFLEEHGLGRRVLFSRRVIVTANRYIHHKQVCPASVYACYIPQ